VREWCWCWHCWNICGVLARITVEVAAGIGAKVGGDAKEGGGSIVPLGRG
jgi:hypothetical protein